MTCAHRTRVLSKRSGQLVCWSCGAVLSSAAYSGNTALEDFLIPSRSSTDRTEGGDTP